MPLIEENGISGPRIPMRLAALKKCLPQIYTDKRGSKEIAKIAGIAENRQLKSLRNFFYTFLLRRRINSDYNSLFIYASAILAF
jgi:hypothetical protein